MSKKAWFYIAFFAAVIFTFYFLTKDFLGTGSSSKLAVMVAEVPSFSFTDQNGKTFTQKDTDGKVYVAEYFFTTCRGICPRMNANMRRVFDTYKNEPGFMILSHTCMPETDSVPLLKGYEQWMINGQLVKKADGSYRIEHPKDSLAPVNNPNWTFVTGDKAKLYNMARHGYLIDNGKPDSTQQIKDQFIHTQFFALVDRNRRVRGIYDGLEEAEVQKLLNDIRELLNEKINSKRFMGGFDNNPG